MLSRELFFKDGFLLRFELVDEVLDLYGDVPCLFLIPTFNGILDVHAESVTVISAGESQRLNCSQVHRFLIFPDADGCLLEGLLG